MEHSPLPWKRCSANEGKCSCGLIWSVPADCTVASAHSVKDEFDEGPTLEQSHINAEFIVRTVNSHDKLLEACKAVLMAIEQTDLNGAVMWIKPPFQAEGIHETAWERLFNVISEVEGESP